MSHPCYIIKSKYFILITNQSLTGEGYCFQILTHHFCRSFTVYAGSDKIGSPSKMYDRLVAVAKVEPVDGNRGGSFLTFFSLSGIKFGILQTISCWGITIVDQVGSAEMLVVSSEFELQMFGSVCSVDRQASFGLCMTI